jgi:hypothetical protein
MPIFNTSVLVTAIEANLDGNQTERIAISLQENINLRNRTRFVHMAHGKNDNKRIGVWTAAGPKDVMVHRTRHNLQYKKIAFHPDFFTTSSGQTSAGIKRVLCSQLQNFQRIHKPAKSAFERSTYTYSGKRDGLQDDLGMAFMMADYHAAQFETDPMYASVRS